MLKPPPQRRDSLQKIREIESLLRQHQTEKARIVVSTIRDQAMREYGHLLINQKHEIVH